MPLTTPRNSSLWLPVSCFTAYPLDETASTASSNSDNADRVDQDICQVVCRFWVTCMDTEVLRYVSDIFLLKPVGYDHYSGLHSRRRTGFRHPSPRKQTGLRKYGRSFTEMMPISRYHTMVCSSVEAISIRFLVREKLEK